MSHPPPQRGPEPTFAARNRQRFGSLRATTPQQPAVQNGCCSASPKISRELHSKWYEILVAAGLKITIYPHIHITQKTDSRIMKIVISVQDREKLARSARRPVTASMPLFDLQVLQSCPARGGVCIFSLVMLTFPQNFSLFCSTCITSCCRFRTLGNQRCTPTYRRLSTPEVSPPSTRGRKLHLVFVAPRAFPPSTLCARWLHSYARGVGNTDSSAPRCTNSVPCCSAPTNKRKRTEFRRSCALILISLRTHPIRALTSEIGRAPQALVPWPGVRAR